MKTAENLAEAIVFRMDDYLATKQTTARAMLVEAIAVALVAAGRRAAAGPDR